MSQAERVERTNGEKLAAAIKVGFDAFHASSEAEQVQALAAIGEYLRRNPALAKALGIAAGARAAEPAPPWAPTEVQTLIAPDGQVGRRIIQRGMTLADAGLQATKSADGEMWDFTYKYGGP